mmetsp:Transcript_15908/g.28247  ORF Transcript_15908/g.28247 Transcript_15908/m.28247 type:complete len:218 (+) Transcript_15908:1464-2117(+)
MQVARECCASTPSFTTDSVAEGAPNDTAGAPLEPSGKDEPNARGSSPSTGRSVVFWILGVLVIVSVVVAGAAGIYDLRSRHNSHLAYIQHHAISEDGIRLDELSINPTDEISGRGSSDGGLDDVPLQTPTGGHGVSFGSGVASPTFAMAGAPANSRSESGVFSAAMRRLNNNSGELTEPSSVNPVLVAGTDSVVRGASFTLRPSSSIGLSDSGSPRD